MNPVPAVNPRWRSDFAVADDSWNPVCLSLGHVCVFLELVGLSEQ